MIQAGNPMPAQVTRISAVCGLNRHEHLARSTAERPIWLGLRGKAEPQPTFIQHSDVNLTPLSRWTRPARSVFTRKICAAEGGIWIAIAQGLTSGLTLASDMKMKKHAAIAISLSLGIAACGDAHRITSLSELRGIRLHITKYRGSQSYVSVSLVIKAGDGKECFLLSSSTWATMDGRPATASSSYGGFRQEDEGACFRYPVFDFITPDLSGPETSTTRFAVSDGSKMLAMDVQDFWIPRKVELSPNTGVLQPGQQATLRWPLSTDLLYPHECGFRCFGALDRARLTSRWPELQGTFGDQAVTVTIPSDAPLGPAQLVWQVDVGAPILRCDGASECIAIAERLPTVDVNITR
jgi:hypothetical protein